MTSQAELEPTDVSLVWQQLSERLDAFVSAWQQADAPPALGEFLPAAPAMLRRLTLVEAIKVDLEYRWQDRRWPKLVEEYLDEFPELAADGGVPCDILYEEYHIRKKTGPVATAEYFDRFPSRADELRRLLDLEKPELTATLVRIEPAAAIEPGQRLDDFDLLSTLGKGAFGTVFLARQCSMQRLVALKVSSDRGSEPQTLAQLDHPHIVRVFDQRQLRDRKLRLLYMQYVAGGTLQGVIEHARQCPPAVRNGGTYLAAIDQSLADKGEQPPADSLARYRLGGSSWPEVVCWVGARIAAALHYAHEHGVLHRDVKPANVLVASDGGPKLADFNISFSKLDGATPAAYFGGSLAYMSPEQLEACNPAHSRQPEDLDARSDVYSLGVMLWEMLTGKRPFPDDRLPANWSQALQQMTALRRAGVTVEVRAQAPADCPCGLAEVLLKCLESEAALRYPSAAAVEAELELCLQPRARQLLHGSAGWQAFANRHPALTTIACGLLPNLVMCLLNVLYNFHQFVGKLSESDRWVFWNREVPVINGVSYAIGLGTTLIVGRRVLRAVAQLAAGKAADPPPDGAMVRRCLSLGDTAALVAAGLWIVSGPIFPLWLQLASGAESRVGSEHYLHFIASNTLSGLIAATQTFYVMTFLSVRYCYPRLMRSGSGGARELAPLAALSWRSRVWFGLSVAIPFIAVTVVVLLDDDNRAPIIVLGAIGLLGFALAYFFDLSLRGDLAALAALLNPSGEGLSAGDSLDSFLSGSRRSRRGSSG